MASEIERLPDLEGFLKFASNPDWLRVKLAYVSFPTARRETRAATAGVPREAAGDLAPRTPAQYGAPVDRSRKSCQIALPHYQGS